MKPLVWILAATLLLTVVYLLGPKPKSPKLDFIFPHVDVPLNQLDAFVAQQDTKAKFPIKPGNNAHIVWADSVPQKTPVALLYLHGFSAGPQEGTPLQYDIAQRYGLNLYVPRLYAHGLVTDEAMIGLTAENYIQSALDALAVAQQLGDTVVVMSCSTGGTLSLFLASRFPDKIQGQILYSPNIDLFDPASAVLSQPWGLYLSRMVLGGRYNQFPLNPEQQQFWYAKYRAEALVALKNLLVHTMKPETFAGVNTPTFVGYYYKNDSLQDNTVSVPRILEMFGQLGTPDGQKRKVALPEVGTHCLCSKYWSKDLPSVQRETYTFAEQVLGLVPVARSK